MKIYNLDAMTCDELLWFKQLCQKQLRDTPEESEHWQSLYDYACVKSVAVGYWMSGNPKLQPIIDALEDALGNIYTLIPDKAKWKEVKLPTWTQPIVTETESN